MASSPQIPRRLSVVQAPQSRNVPTVSAADAAAPLAMLAKSLTEIGDGLEKVAVSSAETAGAEAVRKDDAGNLVVDRLPIIGPAGAAYNRNARLSYLAKAEPEIETKATEMRLQYPNDPDGFQQAWKSFGDEYAGRVSDPLMKAPIQKAIDREGGQAYRSALVQADRLNVSNALESFKSRLTDLDNQGAALARQGGTGTPEYAELRQSAQTLYDELGADARFKFPKERIQQELNAMDSRHRGEAIVGTAMSIFDKSTPTAAAEARKFLQESAWDPKLNLSPAERNQIVTRGMAALEGRTSENKSLIDANKKLVAETIEGLKTTAPYDVRRVNDLTQRSVDIGDVESAYKLASYQVFHGWRRGLQALPIGEAAEAVRAMQQSGSLVDRIVRAESGGNPNAQASTSSALGAGQFVRGTWIDLVTRTRPDLAAGKTPEQILELRRDPNLSREMVAAYAAQNRQQLEGAGVRTDNGALYLAHFLGPGDAIKVLQSQPGQPLQGVVNAASISANASIFARNPTASQLISWAERKVGATPGGMDESRLPGGARPWIEAVKQEAINDVTRSLGARAESMVATLENGIGRGQRPGEAEVRTVAQMLHDTGRLDLVDRVERALDAGELSQAALKQPTGARDAFRAQMKALAADGADPRARLVTQAADDAIRSVETGMRQAPYSMGSQRGLHGPPAPLDYSDPAALNAAVNQRKAFREIVRAHDGPGQISIFNGENEERAFHGTLMSADPKRVAASASLASNLLAEDPDAFVRVGGKKEIEDEALTFRHYVDDLGMNAEQAAGKLIADRMPEVQAKIKAKVKGEDIDDLMRKKLSVSDLEGAFDKIPVVPFTDPQIGFNPRQRAEMFRDYAELTREYYQDKGDLGLAKKLAQAQLKTVWGTSRVNGSDVVMRYPPEQAPGMAAIPNASDLIADDAVKSIAAERGQTVDRGSVALLPIAGSTAAAFKSGQPVPYMLMWQDKNGMPQMLNPGKAFMVDPKSYQARVADEREPKFRRAQEIAATERLIAGEPNRAFGVPP